MSMTSTATQTNDLGDQLVGAVLGINAAWTLSRESGVALIARRADRWECQRVAASYADFAGGNRGTHSIGSALLIPETLEAPLSRPLAED